MPSHVARVSRPPLAVHSLPRPNVLVLALPSHEARRTYELTTQALVQRVLRSDVDAGLPSGPAAPATGSDASLPGARLQTAVDFLQPSPSALPCALAAPCNA